MGEIPDNAAKMVLIKRFRKTSWYVPDAILEGLRPPWFEYRSLQFQVVHRYLQNPGAREKIPAAGFVEEIQRSQNKLSLVV